MYKHITLDRYDFTQYGKLDMLCVCQFKWGKLMLAIERKFVFCFLKIIFFGVLIRMEEHEVLNLDKGIKV